MAEENKTTEQTKEEEGVSLAEWVRGLYRFFGKCRHEWNPWTEKRSGDVTDGNSVRGHYSEMVRTCKHCNETQMKMIQAVL